MALTVKDVILEYLRQGSMSGTDIAKAYLEDTEGKGPTSVANGSIYPSLRDLVRRGLAEHIDTIPAEGLGRTRKIYRLTEKGRKVAELNRDVAMKVYKLISK